MSGFRKAMPFTFLCFIVGGLALSGLPPFSGWLSKDDIIGYMFHRGGFYVVLGVGGELGALITGIYTFRMIFRAFFGDPCPEAVELEHGHLAHAEVPRNPMTGEVEDIDVGFPGPEHVIAEREWPMRIAMSLLALLAVVGGLIQIPGVDHVLSTFLSPAFSGSTLFNHEPTTGNAWLGLIITPIIGIVGVVTAYRLYIAQRGAPARLQERLAPLHTFLINKWYFDELIDFTIVRPALLIGRLAESVLERIVIGIGVTGGVTGEARALSAAVRRTQTGFLRYYAAAMILALSAVALYFLIVS